ncbi:MAG: PTS sugar transporter subunit IIB [Oscillibacter sp.]|jgi:PTS system ascorbate-specific IIB component|nr:PTS sugar transporter subunit IIB [Oscillibacter sp.]
MDIKAKRFNILTCCAAGNGCCQLVMMKVKRVFAKLGLKCNVEANTASVGKALATKYDVVYCSQSLEPQFAEAKKKGAYIIALKNIMSEAEIEEKTRAYLDSMQDA